MCVQVSPGDRALSLLPPWHIYERTVEYHVLSRAASVIYSSVTHFKRDLAAHTPHFMCCVPLLLDRLHARVLASLSKLSAVKSALAQLLVSFSIAHTKVRPPPLPPYTLPDLLRPHAAHMSMLVQLRPCLALECRQMCVCAAHLLQQGV